MAKKKTTKKAAKNKVKRTYHGADAFMLEKSEELQAHFLLDVDDFTPKDSTLDEDYATDWLARINAARNATSDVEVISVQKGKTSTVKADMQACFDAYGDINRFAIKAFKKEPDKLEAFGKGNEYEKARKSQALMVQFMKKLVRVTDKYKTQLLAKGCTQAIIDAATTALTQIDSSNNEQNLTIHTRPELSAARVKLLNDAYSPMAEVILAAKRVYKGNAAKLGEYVYNPPIVHDTTETITDTVPPQTTQLVVELQYDAGRHFTFHAGTVQLTFALSTNGTTSTGTPAVVAPGTTVTKLSSELGTVGNFIVVTNLNATDDGEYEVEYEV